MEGDGAITSNPFFRARGRRAFYFVPEEDRPYNTSSIMATKVKTHKGQSLVHWVKNKPTRIVGELSKEDPVLRIRLPDGRCWAGSLDQAIAMTRTYPKVERGIFAPPLVGAPNRSRLLTRLSRNIALYGALLGATFLVLGVAFWRNQKLRKTERQFEDSEVLTGTLTQSSDGRLFISAAGDKYIVVSELASRRTHNGPAFILEPSVRTRETDYRDQAMPIIAGHKLVTGTTDAYRRRLREGRLQATRWAARSIHLAAWVALGILLFN